MTLASKNPLYYLEVQGTKVGPYTLDQLQTLASQGKISLDSLLIPETQGAKVETLQSVLLTLQTTAFPPKRPEDLPEATGSIQIPPQGTSGGDPSHQLFDALQAARERKGDPSSSIDPAALEQNPQTVKRKTTKTPLPVSKIPDQLWLYGTLLIMFGLSVFGIYQLIKSTQTKPPRVVKETPAPPPIVSSPASPAPKPNASSLGTIGGHQTPSTPPAPSSSRRQNRSNEDRPEVYSPAQEDDPRELERNRVMRERLRERMNRPRNDIRGDAVPETEESTTDSARENDENTQSSDSKDVKDSENPVEGNPAPESDQDPNAAPSGQSGDDTPNASLE